MTNRPKNTHPITGHALQAQGAPHDENGEHIEDNTRYSYNSASGDGRAKCQCGAMSDVLPSRNARARWHRDHKTEARGQE